MRKTIPNRVQSADAWQKVRNIRRTDAGQRDFLREGYSSVFKSRPKVALSPVISPNDSSLPAIENSSELDDSMDSVLNNSSPLAARIFSAEAK